jgi:hypothetical protein
MAMKARPEPQPGNAVEQHEIDRPECAELARPEMAEHAAAQDAEGVEHQERGKHPKVERLLAGLVLAHGRERGNDRHIQHIHGDPYEAAVTWDEEVRNIACQDQYARRNQELAGDIVDARLAKARNDISDIIQRLRCFLWTDVGHDPIRAVAT